MKTKNYVKTALSVIIFSTSVAYVFARFFLLILVYTSPVTGPIKPEESGASVVTACGCGLGSVFGNTLTRPVKKSVFIKVYRK